MGSFSIWHWLIVAFIVLLLFGGKNKISNMMGDLGKGLRSFKDNFKSPDEQKAEEKTDGQAGTPPLTINTQDTTVHVHPEKNKA